MRLIIVNLIVIFIVPFYGCLKPYREIEPQWADDNILGMPLQKIFYKKGEPWIFEFSNNSQYIAMWDYRNRDPYDFSNSPFIGIWDLEGNKIKNAVVNDKYFMSSEFRKLFNRCALREPPYWSLSNHNYTKFTPFHQILKDSMGWFISSDWKFMVCFTSLKYKTYLEELKKDENIFQPYISDIKMEMWTIGAKEQKLWDIPCNGVAKVGAFFEDQGAKILLVSGGDVRIYSCKDGNLLFNFSMRDNATIDELRLRIYDLKLDYRYPEEAKFKPYKCTFSPEKKLIACQDENSKRFRVFSIIPPHKIVCKAHENDPEISRSSLFFKGTNFLYDGIEFAGSGKYLVVSYKVQGRSMFRPIPYQSLTELYDTDTWKIIWQKNTSNIRNIKISNNGKKVALIRQGNIEIGDIESFLNGYKQLELR